MEDKMSASQGHGDVGSSSPSTSDPRAVWESEPNEKTWASDSGYTCVARRGPVGAWCGYVGIPEGHPAFGLSYYKSDYTIREVISGEAAQKAPLQFLVNDLDAHGGLTYAGAKSGGGNWESGLWWFGFDCSHAGDYSPGLDRIDDPVLGLGRKTGWGGVIEYRDLPYVEEQINALAAQLKGIADGSNPAKPKWAPRDVA